MDNTTEGEGTGDDALDRVRPAADEVEDQQDQPQRASSDDLLPNAPRNLRRGSFWGMAVTSSVTFALYQELSKEGHSPRIITGSWPRYVMYGSLGAFVVATAMTAFITYHYGDKQHAFWPYLPFGTSIFMTCVFAGSLHFEPADMMFWSPLAIVLGVVLSVAVRAIYDSPNRRFLYLIRDFFVGAGGGENGEEYLPLSQYDPGSSGAQQNRPRRGNNDLESQTSNN